MSNVRELYRSKVTTAAKALEGLPRRSTVLLPISGGQPSALVKALGSRVRAGQFDEVKLYYMHPTPDTGEALLQRDLMEVVKPYPYFMGAPERALVREAGNRKVVFFVPCNFSAIPGVIREYLTPDAFLLQVAPMDRAGYFSFGHTGAYSLAGIEKSKRIVVEVNPTMPRSAGTGIVHISQVAAVVENSSPQVMFAGKPSTEIDAKIASYVTPYVRDGACVQFGVGSVPNIIAAQLKDRKDLGIHTELLSDGLASLVACGAVTNRRKTTDPGKTIFQCAMGTALTYDLIDDNPSVECRMADYVNDPRVIGLNENVVSVNAMIEVDLTGQVNAEFIGPHEYGGVGGQLDFVRGAQYSKGGLSFIVASSTAVNGKISRIVPQLKGPATDPRLDTQYIATEYGLVDMRGRSSAERAAALISIAHPAFRDELTAAAREMHLL
jgi:itaconate CoA-transferase